MASGRKNIVFVIDHFIPWKAGTEHQLTMLLGKLVENWTVEVIVFRDSPWLEEHAEKLRISSRTIHINNFRSFRTYRNILQLCRYLRRTKPDIVHTFFPVANIIGVITARLAGVSQIISSRRDFGEWMSPKYLQATRFANQFVTAIITNSTRVRAMTHDVEGVDLDRLIVIANGIEVDKFLDLPCAKASRKKLRLPDDALVVGLVANYRPMKRHTTLVRAAALLADEHPKSIFVMVGTNATDDDILSGVVSLAHELGVDDRIVFAHSDADIREFLAVFDIGVNCSEGEGLSNAIMEYMACGLPSVVANSGGNPDLIEHEKNGLLFELDNSNALAARLSELFTSESARLRLGRNAQRTIVANYSVQTMVDKFLDVYNQGA